MVIPIFEKDGGPLGPFIWLIHESNFQNRQMTTVRPKIKEYMDQLLFKISLRYLILAISLLIF